MKDRALQERLMRECITLAKRGGRAVEPNPQVGALVLRAGQIVGRGWHKKFGGAHAEVNALRQAGELARGATLFVTLEPCNHFGKTPPCTQAIIDAGISSVIIGMRDPNPQVTGAGFERLKSAGIDCTIGVLEEECSAINERFIVNATQRRPFVTLKIAQTVDGFIAPRRGTSRWITSEESRRKSHELRALNDCVLVGSGTVRKDNPELTVRDAVGSSPHRAVLTSSLNIPSRAHICTDPDAKRTILLTTLRALKEQEKLATSLRRRGITIVSVRQGKHGLLSLADALEKLYGEGVASLLVEGGSMVFSAFVREHLADRVELFIAPKMLGTGLPVFSGLGPLELSKALHWRISSHLTCGDDVHLTLVPSRHS